MKKQLRTFIAMAFLSMVVILSIGCEKKQEVAAVVVETPAVAVEANVIEEKPAFNLAEVDLTNALVDVYGTNGSKKLIMVTCPECPYCVRADSVLRDMPNVNLTVILLPLQKHVSAAAIVEHIFNAEDPIATYKQISEDSLAYFDIVGDKNLRAYLEGKGYQFTSSDAAQMKVLENLAMAQRVGFKNTPTFIYDGEVYIGLNDELLAKLNSVDTEPAE